MTEKDAVEAFKKCAEWAGDRYLKKVLLLSPTKVQTQIFTTIFPEAKVYSSYREDYNIISGPHPMHYDVIFCGGVLLCIKDYKLALSNLLASCTELWIQEPVRAWRTEDEECIGENSSYYDQSDVNRFSFSKHGEFARSSNANVVDLDTVDGIHVLDAHFYDDIGTDTKYGYKDSRKCLAILRKK